MKDVRRHAGKFATTVVGIGVLLTIVLTMNGLYRGNVNDGTWLIDNLDVDLWVVERDRGGPFNEPSRIALGTQRHVSAVAGVAATAPFVTYTAQRELIGRSQQFTVVGFDPFSGLGGPRKLVAGRPIDAAHFQLIADRKLGLAVGDSARLGRREFEVVGLTRGAVDSGGNPIVFMSLPDAMELQYQPDNEAVRSARVASARALEAQGASPAEAERAAAARGNDRSMSAVLVELAPGTDPEVVRADIARTTFLGVFTTAQERDLMLRGRLMRSTMTLGLFRVLLLIVSVVIMALVVYILTMEKMRSLATLKLLGARNSVIVRLIFEQSLALAGLGFALALALVQLTPLIFPRNLVFETSETLTTLALTILGGCIASVFGIWRALKVPSSLALAGG